MVLANFDELLKKYADLIVHKGINVKKGDYIRVNADIDQAPLARLISQSAYQAGAREVLVKWSDDVLTRLAFEYQTTQDLSTVPVYKIDEAKAFVERRTKQVSLRSSNPNNLAGIDPQKISQVTLAQSKVLGFVRDATQANVYSWLVVAGAGKAWAKLVFPDLPSEEAQVDALWDQIFKTTRIYEADPIKAWDEHEATLAEKADFLNKAQFDALHYTGPGTDLTLGLPKNHIWESAGSHNQAGEIFIANMPTEEVFTAPDFRRADGVITSSKPLAYNGTVINHMTFTFKDGEITDVTADEGQETIRKLVFDNEGSKSLGEVALVPHKSPISQSGITFFNTLFDENASNHLAIGQAYPTSVEGGTQMTTEELKIVGLNRANVHVDFMVGNGEMDIDGITADGQAVPIFRKGEWAI